ncbi:hypothetical protein BDZ97DRAFT_2082716 [Flammula alnicola]|nr:hypothetical protein BDZ97DRAFT_2082716 [Flammula alnicola]
MLWNVLHHRVSRTVALGFYAAAERLQFLGSMGPPLGMLKAVTQDIFLPEIRESVGNRIGFDLLQGSNPVISFKQTEKIAGLDDDDAMLVLKQTNARKPLVGLYDTLEPIQTETIEGFVANLQSRSMGLYKTWPCSSMRARSTVFQSC